VDIFEKDFLIIPINERAHWFLAIVCFAGLSGPVTMKDNRPVDIPKQQQMYPKKVSRKPFNKLPQVATGESFMIGKISIFKHIFIRGLAYHLELLA
jgi:Ulp1 family protease